ncbi:hypothetical protein KM043_010136 [Ampulex compressa]|nr:hypothetical protein KM043_010136 [Ampulex compressa]
MIEEIEVKSQKQMLNLLSSLTYRRTINLNQYRLNVSLFEQYQGIMKLRVKPRPGSVYDYSGGYNGSDGIVLGTIAKYMNFKSNIVYPTDGIKFGYQKHNGTYVGALGDVVYNRTDVCFVSFFVKSYGADMSLMEFTTHVHFDWVCVVVPKAFKIPKWLRIYHFFQPSVWICSALSQIVFFFAWCYIQLLRSRRPKEIDIWDVIYQGFLITTGYPQKLPTSTSERILLAGILMAAVTITGTFNGILYKSFAQDMYYDDIDTLSDLDKTGLPIQYTSYSMNDLFGPRNDSSASPLIRSLRSKLGYGYKSIKHAAYYRNVTGLIRKHNFPLVRKKLVDTDGSHLLHLAEECPSSYYLSYVLPKNSILRERINVIIGRLNQAGITQLWTIRTLQHFASVMRINIEKERFEGQEFVAFKLTDLQTSFCTLGFGWLLSTIVFFHEKGWLKRCFDKGRFLARSLTCRIYRKEATNSE